MPTNAELTERFTALGRPTVIDRLANSSGILQRFYAPDSWGTSDLAVPAAKEALKRAGRKPENVDLIMVGTTSPDYITPDTSVVLQHKLGAKNAGTFDVACAYAVVSDPDCCRLRTDRYHGDKDYSSSRRGYDS
jgi:3-oxoacyl-[acyl-carrier-protein] synthase-3